MRGIGNTPLLKLEKLVPNGGADIYVKFEGANAWAAIQRSKKVGQGKNIITIIIDSGLKYLNTDLFADL